MAGKNLCLTCPFFNRTQNKCLRPEWGWCAYTRDRI